MIGCFIQFICITTTRKEKCLQTVEFDLKRSLEMVHVYVWKGDVRQQITFKHTTVELVVLKFDQKSLPLLAHKPFQIQLSQNRAIYTGENKMHLI